MGIVLHFPNRQNKDHRNCNLEDHPELPCGCGSKENLELENQHLLTKSFITSSEIESLLMDMNKSNHVDSKLVELESLVVFTPEIRSSHAVSGKDANSWGIQWGDVFLKIGDEYPFIFTMYTRRYVRKYFLLYGEMIARSPKDIILDRPFLTPRDTIRATIKWVNCYYPRLKGLPISLEKEEVVQELICDPGEEVIISDSTEFFFV
jgi:hypothetical protein